MKNILAPESRSALDEVAAPGTLLAFDFDGTLAPLVPDRARAALRPDTAVLLRLCSLLYPCAIVSGRPRADVCTRVSGIPLAGVVGNHGREAGRGPRDRALRVAVTRWKDAVGPLVRQLAGVELEDKCSSVALHYRGARARGRARAALMEAAGRLEDALVVPGHLVLNLVPAGSPDKGDAIDELLDRCECERALYVGDDAADEMAFRHGRVTLGIRVGRSSHSSARYYVPRQADVDALLRGLVAARRRADGLHDRVDRLEKVMATTCQQP